MFHDIILMAQNPDVALTQFVEDAEKEVIKTALFGSPEDVADLVDQAAVHRHEVLGSVIFAATLDATTWPALNDKLSPQLIENIHRPYIEE